MVAEAGADCAQLEFFHPPANLVGNLPFYKIVEDLSFSRDQWRDIMSHARTRDIAISAFVYDDVSMGWALDLKPDMIKLNSSDISNPDLIVMEFVNDAWMTSVARLILAFFSSTSFFFASNSACCFFCSAMQMR